MKRWVKLVSAAGILFSAFLSASIFAHHAHTQSPPAIMYGTAKPGDKVEAFIRGKACATVTAGHDGYWKMQISEGGRCEARDGDQIRFTLNGKPTPQIEIWRSGGAPKTVSSGVVLTAYERSSSVAGSGLIYPSSPWIVVMIGAFLLAGIAGFRAMNMR